MAGARIGTRRLIATTTPRSRRASRFGAIAVLVLAVCAAGTVGLTHHRTAVPGVAEAAESVIGVGDNGTPQAIRHVGTATLVTRSDDAVVAGVLDDVATFWSAAMPKDFGKAFVPLSGGYVSIDSTAASGTSYCISTPGDIAGNAYYCPSGDAIVYDSAGLIPVLIGHYGVAGLTASFAHEFGHAVQARIGPTPAERSARPKLYPSVLIEAQGDCYSGAFLAWAVAGHTSHVRLPESSMVRAVAPILDFGDSVDVALDDPTAHGLALDRLSDLLVGYRTGPIGCHSLTRAALQPTLGRPELIDTPKPDRFADTASALTAGRRSVETFVRQVVPSKESAAATPAPADLTAAKPYGQFADAAALALAVGRTVTGSAAGAACFTGAWTRSVFGHSPSGALGSWGGDADEALNMLRARPSADFTELAGYADGFTKGWTACTPP